MIVFQSVLGNSEFGINTRLAVMPVTGGSPHSITDDFDEDPKMRLHHAICRLNRHQLQRLIHFGRDGTGNGIRWEPWNKKR